MNYTMVRRLILKDWYLHRFGILASIVGGILCFGIIVLGGTAGFILGQILLVTLLIAIGAHLAVSTIVYERKEQTLPFVMSLPISYREYTTSKILGNLLIFLVPWLALVLGSCAIIMLVPKMPHGFLPYVVIMSVEILLSTCLVASVAVVTESQGWSIGAIIVGNLGFNGFGYLFAHIGGIARGMGSATIQWSTAASTVLLSEFCLIALMLGFTFFLQSRKKDFI
jgi:ABC-2 type transport system permease protein